MAAANHVCSFKQSCSCMIRINRAVVHMAPCAVVHIVIWCAFPLEWLSPHSIESVWLEERQANCPIQKPLTVSTQLSRQDQVDSFRDEAWGSGAKYQGIHGAKVHHRNVGLEAQRPGGEQLGQTLSVLWFWKRTWNYTNTRHMRVV